MRPGRRRSSRRRAAAISVPCKSRCNSRMLGTIRGRQGICKPCPGRTTARGQPTMAGPHSIVTSRCLAVTSIFAFCRSCRLRRKQHLRGAAAAQGDGGAAGQAHGHPLPRGHRQHRRDQHRRSGGACLRFCPSHQVPRWRFVKKGTVLFIIEQQPYELKLKAGQGLRRQRQATLSQGRGRLPAPGRSCRAAPLRKPPSIIPLGTRDSAKASLDQAVANTRLAELDYGYTTWPRPSTASSPRARSRSAPMSAAAPRRPCWPPSCRSIRST